MKRAHDTVAAGGENSWPARSIGKPSAGAVICCDACAVAEQSPLLKSALDSSVLASTGTAMQIAKGAPGIQQVPSVSSERRQKHAS